MSHWTELKTNITDKAILVQALKDLGYTVISGVCRGYAGNKITSDVVVQMEGNYDVGFLFTEGETKIIGDEWGINLRHPMFNLADFTKEVKKKYSHNKVMDEIRKQGYTVASETTENGQIKILARHW